VPIHGIYTWSIVIRSIDIWIIVIVALSSSWYSAGLLAPYSQHFVFFVNYESAQ